MEYCSYFANIPLHFTKMKTYFNYLPLGKQNQILEIVEIIREVVSPEKIILFDSDAQGKYVEPCTGK